MTETLGAATEAIRTRHAVIDADVHNVVPSVQALFPYLPVYWREHINQSLFKGATESAYPKNAPTTARSDSIPPDGGVAGSRLDLLQEQILDPHKVEFAILACTYAIDSLRNPDAAI